MDQGKALLKCGLEKTIIILDLCSKIPYGNCFDKQEKCSRL
jgi:hypothetical protein